MSIFSFLCCSVYSTEEHIDWMSKLENRILWEKFLSGDDKAYVYIYEKYVQSLFAFGLQYISDREVLKDCIQDVFIKIYKNRKSLNSTDNIKLYLFIALKNHLLNTLKKDKNMHVWIDSVHPDSFFDPDSEDIYIEREEKEMQSREIDRMMEVLSPKQQKVMHYRYIECLSISEIQELMGVNYQSVVNLLQRSMIKLRNSFPEKKDPK